jgi:hypothetical protein
MTRCALSPVDEKDRSLWRGRIHGAKQPTWVNLDVPLVLSQWQCCKTELFMCVLLLVISVDSGMTAQQGGPSSAPVSPCSRSTLPDYDSRRTLPDSHLTLLEYEPRPTLPNSRLTLPDYESAMKILNIDTHQQCPMHARGNSLDSAHSVRGSQSQQRSSNIGECLFRTVVISQHELLIYVILYFVGLA